MLAATAASRWGGWREVTRLLDGQRWVDSAYDGEGRLLLARAALEQGADSAALRHAWPSRARTSAAAEGERLVLLATALERLRARDSAAASYVRAAERLPSIAGWLRIRAAAVTDDASRARGCTPGSTDPLARDRIGWSEAAAHRVPATSRARPRATPPSAPAPRRFASGWPRAPTARPRAAVRRDLAALVAARRSPGEVRDAIALLDSAFAPLTPAEELEVGRAAATAGSHTRAVAAFERRALRPARARHRRGPLRLRHDADPARPSRRRGAAVRARARAPRAGRLRRLPARPGPGPRRPGRGPGRLALARRAPPAIRGTPPPPRPRSSSWAISPRTTAPTRAPAATSGRSSPAIPAAGFAPTAAFRAAMIALLAGDAGAAAAEFDGLARRYPRSDEAGAADLLGGPRLGRRGRHRRRPRALGAARRRRSRLLLHRPRLPPARSARWTPAAARRQLRPDSRAPTAPWRAPALLARLGPAGREPLGVRSPGAAERHARRSGCSRWPHAFRRRRAGRAGHPARPPRAGARRAGPTRAPIACCIRSCSRTRCWPRRAEHGLDAGLRRGAHPPGVDVQSHGDLPGRRARADAGHARPRRPAGAVAGLSRVGPGAALPAGREPAARCLSTCRS